MKKTVCTLLILIVSTALAYAADEITASNISVPQGGTARLEIVLSNPEGNYSGFQFDLRLPSGISVTKIEQAARLAALENYQLQISNGQNNVYTVIGFHQSNPPENIGGTSGAIAYVTLSAEATLEVNSVLTGQLKNVTMTSVELVQTDGSSSSFSITIGEPSFVTLDETSTTAPSASDGEVNVRVLRTIKANTWSTICLPFAMNEQQVKTAFGNDVELGDFSKYETIDDANENIVGITVNFAEATEIESNHPYIIKVSEAVSEFNVDGVTIEPDEYPCVEYDNGKTGSRRKVLGTFAGTYVADFDFYQDAYDNDECKALFLNGNKFYYATEQTKHMKAFRAYFYFVDCLASADESSPARIALTFSSENTKIDDIGFQPTQDGRVYTLSGQYVGDSSEKTKLPKGVYVVSGKKRIVK